MKRTAGYALLVLSLLFVVAGMHAQEVSGQVFAPTPGMKYHDYKDHYDTKNYKRSTDDKYSTVWTGLASFIVPGLGQAIENRWGSAAGFFIADVGTAVGAVCAMKKTEDGGRTKYTVSPVSYAFVAANLFLNIWSIVDAVDGAKIKNMYMRDVTPYLDYALSLTEQRSPVVGLAVRLSF